MFDGHESSYIYNMLFDLIVNIMIRYVNLISSEIIVFISIVKVLMYRQ